MHSEKTVRKVLETYQSNPDLSTKALAKKFGISSSTVIEWAEKHKLRRRPRGRRPQTEPTLRHRQIIEMAQTLTHEQTGAKLGVSKQRVHRIIHRWQNWERPSHPPFAPGDIIRWNGQKYTVLVSGLYDGTVLDSKGRTVLRFSWSMKGKQAVKIGHNLNVVAGNKRSQPVGAKAGGP